MANETTHAELGINRTGIETSPLLSKDMVEGMDEFSPTVMGDEHGIALARGSYARDADPIGTVPPPLTGKGMLKSAMTAVIGESPTQLIDKLGERLAFERTGTRLYEAIMSKLDACGSYPGGPTQAELAQIVADEHDHFRLLHDALVRMGADPTVMTPSADLHATLSKGLLEGAVDPRTTLAQSLEAALVAELADNECWLALKELAQQANQDELAQEFATALVQETRHLRMVRSWIAAAQGRDTAAPISVG